MGANKRLQDMQSALLKRGVRDVKFCFSPGLSKMPYSEVASRTADFVDAYLRGRFQPLDKIGDAPVA